MLSLTYRHTKIDKVAKDEKIIESITVFYTYICHNYLLYVLY